MDASTRARATPDAAALLRDVADLVPNMQARAEVLDCDGAFPHADLNALRDAGALAAPLPRAQGGLGLGTEAGRSPELARLLGLIGRGSLPLGRIFEGHVNALHLIVRYGDPAQVGRGARDAHAGELFGVWNTEPRDAPLRVFACRDGWRLQGRKILASGAGVVTRALVTAERPDGARVMLVVPLAASQRADLRRWTAQGMRASATGAVVFDGIVAPPDAVIGEHGDYERQPVFSGGAWRALAVIVGGLDALVDALRAHLAETKRDGDPHQQARAGTVLIAQETARLWLQQAAARAERGCGVDGEVVAYVNLARGATEAAVTEAMRLVQRSVGLAAFMRPNPIERLCRDLGTYLRQPAPDAALTNGAAWFLRNGGLPEPLPLAP
ncbi:MAG TPA: acyl-CoA dehydrogenase family protein [Acidisphaera sp.]|nr:acyl-CoA dehydrogenase family protein [Acidisphaera sp.]